MNVARELLNRHSIAVRAGQTVLEAAQLLNALDQRFLPVVDERQQLIGTFGDRELWDAWSKTENEGLSAPVARYMCREPVTLEPEADLAEIVDLMLDHNSTVVPVIDAAGRLLGVVTYADVLRRLSVH
jgi:acetoin utilization protein AcuB